MRKKNIPFLLILLVLLTIQCKKDEGIQYNVDFLVETDWGYPMEVESNQKTDFYTHEIPLDFRRDGIVYFGSNYQDFWRQYDSESIIIEQKKQLWVIKKLTPDTLYVSKLSHPDNEFIVSHIYNPVDTTRK